MPQQVDFSPGLAASFFNGLLQARANQQVRTFRVQTDAGKIRTVPSRRNQAYISTR